MGPGGNVEAPAPIVFIGLRADDVDRFDLGPHPLAAVVSERSASALRAHADRIDASLVVDVPGRDMDEYDVHVDQITRWVRAWDPTGHARVVSIYEHTQSAAAAVREALGQPGMSLAVARRCRDKVAMAEAIEARGVPVVPALAVGPGIPVRQVVTWLSRLDEPDGPVVLKPRSGAASSGVRVFPSAAALGDAFTADLPVGHEVQPFISAPVCHIDGLVRDGRIAFLSAGRYWGTTLAYTRDRKPMGSVSLEREDQIRALAFADKVLDALEVTDSVFHMEAFLTESGFVFLEIGARYGGINIQPHLRAVHGVNLIDEAVRAQALLPSRIGGPVLAVDRGGHSAGASGWLIVPRPTASRARVVRADAGKALTGVLDLQLVHPGDVLPAQESGLAAVASCVVHLNDGKPDDVEKLIERLTAQITIETETQNEEAG